LVELEGSLVAGKYRIKRRIGVGGMGAVYEGEHVEIGKRVAIKVIEHEHARSEELAARFRREARAASAVESEHIVHVFDVGHDEKVGLYMVMELLVGEDLASRLEKSGGKIPVDEAVTIATQAARALGRAHAAGVVHRDLKPANLFLTTREDGTVAVKILDFGISKLVRPGSDAKSSALTREGSVMGTPTYMSPEQAQGLPVDARTDIWSLASVLYEALAGRTAYAQRDTYEQMIVQIVTQKPRPIEEVAPWVPAPIARVLETALVHDVEARASDAAAFAKKLAEAARIPTGAPSGTDATVLAPASDPAPASSARSGAAAPPPTSTGVVVGVRTQPDAGLPPKRSSFTMIALAGAVLIGAIVVFALVTREPSPKSATQGGLVAAPPSAEAVAPSLPSASTPTTIILAPTTTPSAADPASSASATPASGSASATVASSRSAVLSDAGSRPTSRPASAASPPTSTKAGTTQYGAAGVSTAY
jgi:serine/threonine protein kinase